MLWRDVPEGTPVCFNGGVYTVTAAWSQVGGVTLDGKWTGRPDPDADVELPGEVFFDLESADADELFLRSDFVRLAGWARADGPVVTSPEIKALIEQLEAADQVTGHGILEFDLLALCHHYGVDWEVLAGKAKDTLLLSRLDSPPRARHGDKYDMNTTAARLNIPGKTADLRPLAREFGGFDEIPVDEPRYVDYLKGDVECTRLIGRALPMTPYAAREHRIQRLAGHISLNGFRVDVPLLRERIELGKGVKADALRCLRADYGLPGVGLSTKVGKAWWADLVKGAGWLGAPVTEKGALSMSATALADACPPAALEAVVGLMRTVTTVRTVYQTVADNLVCDRVHPRISMGQATGRWSVTKPGMTVFGKRGGRHVERDIFLPEDGESLTSCDLSQVDMRAIAGLCQDPAYMALFEPGRDVHTEIAIQVFGGPEFRSNAKEIGHGANYGLSANSLIRRGFDPVIVHAFYNGMEEAFPRRSQWREEIRAAGARGEFLDNGFGRMMRCEPDRAYTQAPALMGQGAARDLMCDALLRLPESFRSFLRPMIHDEILISCPDGIVEEVQGVLLECFTSVWRDVPILCDVSAPGKTWGIVSAK